MCTGKREKKRVLCFCFVFYYYYINCYVFEKLLMLFFALLTEHGFVIPYDCS